MLLAFSRARAVEPGVWRTLRRGRAVLGMASPSESWSSRLRKGYSRKPGGGKPRATSNSADEPLGGDPLLPVTRGLWTRRQLHGGVRAASPRPRRLADRHRLVQQPPRLWHVARQNNARGRARRAGRGARRPRRAAALPRRAVRLPRFGGKRRYGARRGRAGARRPARLALLLRPGGWAIGTAASTSRTRWSASSATGHCFGRHRRPQPLRTGGAGGPAVARARRCQMSSHHTGAAGAASVSVRVETDGGPVRATV